MLSYCDNRICFPNWTDEIADAERVANKALEIDKTEPTVLTILRNIAVQKDWDSKMLKNYFKKCYSCNTRTMRDYAELCIMTGRYDEAWKLAECINTLDPVNHHNFKIRFWLHLVFKELQKAGDVVRQHLLLYPDPPLDQILHAHIHLIRGNPQAAIRYLCEIDCKQEMPLSWNHALLVGIGYGYAVTGQREKSL